jgi:2-dehydropantoate 2-reductase
VEAAGGTENGDLAAAGAYAIVGAGSLGLALAAALAASRQVVTVLASINSAAGLLEAGKVQLDGLLDLRVPVSGEAARPGHLCVVDDPRRLPPVTGTIFATKGHQLESAVGQVAAAGPGILGDCWFAGLQNGVVKDDVLAAAFGPARVLGAATVLNARRTEVARVTVGSLGMTYFGELGAAPSPRVTAACEAFGAAGLPATVVDDGRSLAWSKFANAVGIFAVTGLTGLTTGAMTHRRPLVLAYRSLLEEVDAVAVAEGVRIGDYPGLPMRTYLDKTGEEVADIMGAGPYDPAGPQSFSSMAQDIAAGRKTESEQIFADLARRGRRHGVPTPRVDLVNDLISGIDARP